MKNYANAEKILPKELFKEVHDFTFIENACKKE